MNESLTIYELTLWFPMVDITKSTFYSERYDL